MSVHDEQYPDLTEGQAQAEQKKPRGRPRKAGHLEKDRPFTSVWYDGLKHHLQDGKVYDRATGVLKK